MMINVVVQVVVRIINAVLFPALSEVIRERPSMLQKTYYQLHSVIASTVYFCCGALITSGQSLIDLFYDPRYAQAGWMMEILAVTLLAVPFQLAIYCFIALGMPRLNTYVLFGQLVLLFIAMPFGFHFFGLPGAIWGYVCSQILSLPIVIFYCVRHGLFSVRRELLQLPSVLVGAGVGKIFAAVIGYWFRV
jgi:O-antigen/teichoic acid export membrane protein